MTIYTRTGDAGVTSISGGRVSKADFRIEVIGVIDEANSSVGFARTAATPGVVSDALDFVQHRLSNCAAHIAAVPGAQVRESIGVSADDVAYIERTIDVLEDLSGPLRGFVLPGGNELAARLHVARTVVRRAERRVAAMAPSDEEGLGVLRFLNRVSDLLFAAARVALVQVGVAEEMWDPEKLRPPD